MVKAFAIVKIAMTAWVVGSAPTVAHAEEMEITSGVSGGGLFPSFSSPSPTSFTLAAWSAGAFGHYGLTDNLSLGGSFDFVAFEGESNDQVLRDDPLHRRGTMRFHGRFYHPQAFARYTLFGGYDWAPYAQLGVGYLWATYLAPSALSADTGAGLNLNIRDFAQGSATLSASVRFEYRLFDFVITGVGLTYCQALTGMLERYVHVPITLAAYW